MSTDLSPEEREAMEALDHIGYLIRRFATIKDRETSEHFVRDLATIRSVLAAREYSKQREEKLRKALREVRHSIGTAVRASQIKVAEGRELFAQIDAALAENGDTDD